MSISNPPADDAKGALDGSHNREDDPHRLLCICRTPRNNRFIICCDECSKWFHGKCVGVSKPFGREIEERQNNWICPQCAKRRQSSINSALSRKNVVDNLSTTSKEAESTSSHLTLSSTNSTISKCMVCGTKPPRENSIYCSDDCIRRYAFKTVNCTVTSSSGNDSEPTASATTKTIPLKSISEEKKKNVQTKVGHHLFKDKLNHVVVFDKTTGHFVTGKNAPTIDKLQQWLAKHPHHELLKPGTQQAMAFRAKQLQLKSIGKKLEDERELFAVTKPVEIQTKLRFDADKMVYINPSTLQQMPKNTLKRPISATFSPVNTKSPVQKSEPITKVPRLITTPVQNITVQKKHSANASKNPCKSEPSDSKLNERDRLRINARKSLVEQLLNRTNEITDPNAHRLTESEIMAFVNEAEKEMFAMFGGDTNMKYKSKYRSLMYNIKDRKNLTLFEKISSKMIKPKQLVRLPTEELASQELAKWRENENKQQLQMITKSELNMLACGNSYVLKTHKSEEVIQECSNRITLDPSIPVKDVISVLNNSTRSSSSSDRKRSKHYHDVKDRRRESSKKTYSSKPKIRKPTDNSMTDKILKAQSTIDSILHSDELKKNDNVTAVNVSSVPGSEENELIQRQPSIGNESYHKPKCTATMKPRLSLATPAPVVKSSNIEPTVWSGTVSMVDVTTFHASLSPLSTSTAMIEFPKEFDIVGRINPDTVWDYLSQIRASKDIVLLRFTPRSSEDDKTAYSALISYLDTRKRLGVIKIPSKLVKDFYVMPLTSQNSLPSILGISTGFELGADRPDLLLGIIVRNRISRPSHHLPIPPEARYHKPATNILPKEYLFTPPSSPNMSMHEFLSNLDDDEPYSPGGSDDDDLPLSTILTSHLSRTNANPVPDYTVPAELGVQRQAKDTIMTGFQELNFKQEMELQVTANSLEQA